MRVRECKLGKEQESNAHEHIVIISLSFASKVQRPRASSDLRARASNLQRAQSIRLLAIESLSMKHIIITILITSTTARRIQIKCSYSPTSSLRSNEEGKSHLIRARQLPSGASALLNASSQRLKEIWVCHYELNKGFRASTRD